MPSWHRRAIADILACRTEALGGHLWRCDRCSHEVFAYHSCRNRSCPKCHTRQTAQWLEARKAEMLPTGYFHVVVTLPQELRALLRANQRDGYGLLMKAAADAIIELARDRRFVGGTVGVLAVHSRYRALSSPLFSVNNASWSSAPPPCRTSLPVRWRRSTMLRMGSASKSRRLTSQGARGVTCSRFNRPASTSLWMVW